MPKGNWTKTNRNPTRIIELSSQYGDDCRKYREYAEARRNSTPFTQEMLGTLHEKAMTYFSECAKKDIAPTIGRLCVNLGINRNALHRAKNGDYDYRLPQYLDLKGICHEDVMLRQDELFGEINPLQYCIDAGQEVLLMLYSEIAWRWIEYVESCIEQSIVEGQKPVGSIFYAKSVFGFSDSPDQAQVAAIPRIANRTRAKEITSKAVEELAYQRLVACLEKDSIEEKVKAMQKSGE